MFYRVQFKCLSLLAMGVVASAVAAQTLSAAPSVAVARSTMQSQATAHTGKGVRTDASGPLYTASLSSSVPLTSVEAAVAKGSTRLIQVRMLRPVTSAQVGDLLASGLASNNSDDALFPLVSEVFELGKLIGARKQLKAGEGFDIEWSASNETRVTVMQAGVKRVTQKTFTNPNLAEPLLRIWLGERPVDARLKQALIGPST